MYESGSLRPDIEIHCLKSRVSIALNVMIRPVDEFNLLLDYFVSSNVAIENPPAGKKYGKCTDG